MKVVQINPALYFFFQAGGYLAEPQTLRQMEALSEFAFIDELEHGSLNWWIGTLDSGHEGRWTWHSSGEVFREIGMI